MWWKCEWIYNTTMINYLMHREVWSIVKMNSGEVSIRVKSIYIKAQKFGTETECSPVHKYQNILEELSSNYNKGQSAFYEDNNFI